MSQYEDDYSGDDDGDDYGGDYGGYYGGDYGEIYDSDDNFEPRDNETESRGEFKDRERTSDVNTCITSEDIELKNLTPTEKFKYEVNKVVKELKIDNVTRDEICNMSDNLNVVYLNPTAFVIGYLVTLEGRINETKLKKMLKTTYDDNSVKQEDIIRYARFFTTLNPLL